MKEVFELQWSLNAHTLKNIGLDYAAVTTDPETIPTWIENYRKALSAELAELIRDVRQFGIGSQNGRIEVVDMLHFLVSLSHIVAVEPGAAMGTQALFAVSFDECAIRTFLALDELQNSVKWKWWAKGGGYKEDKAREAVMALWKCFWTACDLFSMDFSDVKRIYIAKNQVNFERQRQNYNEDTKTEEDNRAIRA